MDRCIGLWQENETEGDSSQKPSKKDATYPPRRALSYCNLHHLKDNNLLGHLDPPVLVRELALAHLLTELGEVRLGRAVHGRGRAVFILVHQRARSLETTAQNVAAVWAKGGEAARQALTGPQPRHRLFRGSLGAAMGQRVPIKGRTCAVHARRIHGVHMQR